MRTWVQRIRAIGPWIAPAMGAGLVTLAGVSVAAQQAAGQADQAQAVLADLRAAMGGDKAAAVKSLSAEGSQRITFGEREITNDLQLKLVLPDHFMRIMQPEMPNGMPGPRFATTMNGSEVWTAPLDPMPNFGGGPGGGGRGPGGGGMMIMGPGGFGGGAPNPQQIARQRADLLRYMIGMVPSPDTLPGVTVSYVGTAQSQDGEADVLAVKAEGLDAKLFIDKKTHLPLMATYMAPDMSRIRQFRGPGGPGGGPGGPGGPGGQAQGQGQADPNAPPNETPEAREKRIQEERQKRAEEIRKQIEAAPMVENQLFYADYKKVDGVMLPHRFTRSVNGNAADEIEIKKYKINPKIDLNDFQKKGS
jgi:hypothetical protein